MYTSIIVPLVLEAFYMDFYINALVNVYNFFEVIRNADKEVYDMDFISFRKYSVRGSSIKVHKLKWLIA